MVKDEFLLTKTSFHSFIKCSIILTKRLYNIGQENILLKCTPFKHQHGLLFELNKLFRKKVESSPSDQLCKHSISFCVITAAAATVSPVILLPCAMLSSKCFICPQSSYSSHKFYEAGTIIDSISQTTKLRHWKVK